MQHFEKSDYLNDAVKSKKEQSSERNLIYRSSVNMKKSSTGWNYVGAAERY